jgi:hypothetical protein
VSFPMNVGSNQTPIRRRSVRWNPPSIGEPGSPVPQRLSLLRESFLEVVPHHASYSLLVCGVFRLVRWYPLERGRDIREMTEIAYY